MHKKFQELVDRTMSPEARRRADELALKNLAEMELAELREALHVRQEDLAEELKVTQAAISRLERRSNVQVQSIANYVEGLGGRLELCAILPNRTVRLTHLFAAKKSKRPSARRRAARAR
jgi:transcriptional regulator with XRE-family HTH domain